MDLLARSGKLGADASEADLLAATAAYGGNSSSQARVDDDVYHHTVQALEKAFSFYDADSSNSIDVREVEAILRSLGQDPTRRELKALMRRADKDRNGVLQVQLQLQLLTLCLFNLLKFGSACILHCCAAYCYCCYCYMCYSQSFVRLIAYITTASKVQRLAADSIFNC
jgi:EF-hand domain pair